MIKNYLSSLDTKKSNKSTTNFFSNLSEINEVSVGLHYRL